MTTALTLAAAQRMIQATIEHAKADGKQPVSLAVVDHTGTLLAFARMDGAPQRVVLIAQRKAYTAAKLEVSTRDFHDRLLRESLCLADFCDAQFTSLSGGVPLYSGGRECIGAVGVSGRTLEDDIALAAYFASALHTGS